ncbi:glycosyltransferase family 2 protein [Actinorugispora endophytica]|uniref:Glucosyl-3-phosphoglycerate synthase n=1 Tax=Actinorugispora endophytica TaxID=1605990 RepID=A0A4R6UXW5_9ACTN|nr:glycosyltransferase [Actinorugispora endophytica]TDQ52307.1 glycosyl transferase family 2 [Actinorugispora endophytica]
MDSSTEPGRVAVVIPARNEGDRVAATIGAARGLPGVDLVVVVDDGSSDDTVAAALGAGARVFRHGRNRGKGTAMETGAEAVGMIEEREAASGVSDGPRHLLFLDADLGATAAAAAPLIEPVRAGAADMTVALFPTNRTRLGGHGFVVRLARGGIRRATGWEAEQPLNGQRCLTRKAFGAALPLAPGFGVETGLTIDLLHRGFVVLEVEVPMEHRATGTDLRAQLHRARQFADVARALAVRDLRPAIGRALRRARRDSGAADLSVALGGTRSRNEKR